MQELNQEEINEVSGAGFLDFVAMFDALYDGMKGFWRGVKAGAGEDD